MGQRPGRPIQKPLSRGIVWLPVAEAELQATLAYYPSIRTELVQSFAGAVENTIEAIEAEPLRFAAVIRGRRRAGVSRFPYGIFFLVEENRLVVIACFHAKRDPMHWALR